MMNQTPEERKPEIADVAWHHLAPHLERDALIVVSSELDLKESAMAVARDDTTTVQGWIDTGKFAKPSAEQLAKWEQDRTREFTCTIAQPFVLIQDKGSSSN
jgi:hypothetical protein